MSAPIASVLLAQYAGDMLKEIASNLSRHGSENGYGTGSGVRCRIEWSSETTNPFHVYLDESLHTFHGTGEDAGAALMAANLRRQSFYEERDRQRSRFDRVAHASVSETPWMTR